MPVKHINPDGLFQMDGFSQVVVAQGGRTVYIAGQGAFDKDMKLIGDGDYYRQTMQAFKNLNVALAAADAKPEDIVSSTMYVKDLDEEATEAFIRGMNDALKGMPFPPNASSLIGVQGLAMPGMLVEISAIAVVDD